MLVSLETLTLPLRLASLGADKAVGIRVEIRAAHSWLPGSLALNVGVTELDELGEGPSRAPPTTFVSGELKKGRRLRANQDAACK